ncbi:hypothetical protein JTB14_027622 [Gonioctena quinquepunctata]|nr:hypothetical protein JTB14_027622 [Gonioctena quinquepunctata]
MLTNRITVHINDKKSHTRTIQNGLPQGSVLVPPLFNIYENDLPPSTAQKCIYARDMALANRHTCLELGGDQLTDDLEAMHDYYTKWWLKTYPTQAGSLHLSSLK